MHQFPTTQPFVSNASTKNPNFIKTQQIEPQITNSFQIHPQQTLISFKPQIGNSDHQFLSNTCTKKPYFQKYTKIEPHKT